MMTPVPLRCRYGDSCREIFAEDLAYYVYFECGLTFAQFVAWLANEIATLEAIDPERGK